MNPTPIDPAPLDTSGSAALFATEAVCQARGVQLTPLRKSVLLTLWAARQPLGAYDVLKRMETALDRRLTPPTVYRALDFLLEQNLVHKIESRNAFVPCTHPDHPTACAFFICEKCGSSKEIEDAGFERLFARKASAFGFRIGKRVLELQGMCAACQGASLSASAGSAAIL